MSIEVKKLLDSIDVLRSEIVRLSWYGEKTKEYEQAKASVKHLYKHVGDIVEAVQEKNWEGWVTTKIRVLRLAPDRTLPECLDRARQQVRPASGQAIMQTAGGILRPDGFRKLINDVAGIHACVDEHRGHAGFGFAIGHSPLDGRRPAIFWQERGVHINAPPFAQGATGDRSKQR